MCLDVHNVSFHAWRAKLSRLFYPLQVVLFMPELQGRQPYAHWQSNQQLLTENTRLRTHDLLLEANMQRLLHLQRENKQLKLLLGSSARIHEQIIEASLLSVAQSVDQRSILLDLGSRAGVRVNEPVLDAFGVFGQVVDVTPLVSKVLLITDARSAVPVEDARSGVRAIAVGDGGDYLHLLSVPLTSDIRVGDLWVTSGMGLRYPAGYPVGLVRNRHLSVDHRFAQISLQPQAHLRRSREFMLIADLAKQKQALALQKAPIPAVGEGSS